MAGSAGDRFVRWVAGREVLRLVPVPPPAAASGCFAVSSLYVETFWLPVLGPSAVLAARSLDRMVTAEGSGALLDLVEFGPSLGLAQGVGRNSPAVRTLARLVSFGCAVDGDDHLGVLVAWPPVPLRLRGRLPPSLGSALVSHDAARAAAEGH